MLSRLLYFGVVAARHRIALGIVGVYVLMNSVGCPCQRAAVGACQHKYNGSAAVVQGCAIYSMFAGERMSYGIGFTVTHRYGVDSFVIGSVGYVCFSLESYPELA